MNLLAVARWANQSSGRDTNTAVPRLLLPPIQRSAVWRWSQVLDFWDSVFRGMPIGSFYVMPSAGSAEKGRRIKEGKAETIAAREGDYFLLDGQQRMRALLAGLESDNADQRCLWIDLAKLKDVGDPSAVIPCLFLTSAAQPFGYDPSTGNKLRANDRRDARNAFSKDGESDDIEQRLWRVPDARSTMQRKAYNQDLFGHAIELRKGTTTIRALATPPQPFKASATAVPLWKLIASCESVEMPGDGSSHVSFRKAADELGGVLSGWTASADPDINANVADQARKMEGSDALEVLARMVIRLRAAQVAFIRVEVGSGWRQVQSPDLPLLFTRIGAGGSPLTQDERLYSIYKHYVPEVHTLVERIHEGVGRVLSPTGIAMTALRIANVQRQEGDRNVSVGTPDEKAFREAMDDNTASDGPTSLKWQLAELLPSAGCGPLERSFELLRDAVAGKKRLDESGIENAESAFWIPDVLLAGLSQNLWQVLVYWAFKNRDAGIIQHSRPELVRFILFWHLCVQNDDKASSRAFDTIRQQEQQPCFPGKALYEVLIDKAGGNPVALELSLPEHIREVISIKEPEPGLWPSWKERFEDPQRASDPDRRRAEQLAARWWPRKGGGERLLPWLQRAYIAEKFGDYAPLSNHEDDLPYDIDHICAENRFNGHWTKAMFPDLKQAGKAGESALAKLRANRDLMGNSIGNLQLLGLSENRRAGDAHHSRKPPTYKASMTNPWWGEAEKREPATNRAEWGQHDRAGFQRAVEDRAVFLYCRFFEDLAYLKEWGISSSPAANPET